MGIYKPKDLINTAWTIIIIVLIALVLIVNTFLGIIVFLTILGGAKLWKKAKKAYLAGG